jgi:hypothetical protein
MDAFSFYEDYDNLFERTNIHQHANFSFDDKPFSAIELITADDPHIMFLNYYYHIPCEPGQGFIIDDEYEDENGNVHPERRGDYNVERHTFVLEHPEHDINDFSLNQLFHRININPADYSIENWQYDPYRAEGEGISFQEYVNMPFRDIKYVAGGDFHRIYPEDEPIHIDEEDDL